MFIPTYEEMSTINEKALKIEKSIESLLSDKRDYDEIEKILSRDEIQEIALRNQRIYIFYSIFDIFVEEKNQNVDCTLLDYRTIDEAINVYKILSLYLRRIEFDLPEIQKNEIISYILRERISMVAVMGIIKSNKRIIQKEKIINGLKEILMNYSSGLEVEEK
ncbi:MAG: hypothetical protein K6G75_13095 [Lachnospiraceae bacterium]|nr:hypothetical protein [Lachnospiraceae bacterium]